MNRSHVENTVTSSGNFPRHQFRVDSNSQMFQLVISNLYSRIEEAIIRELSCNAYDAHVDSGNKLKPFDIKLPNSLDHTFYIKDYGTGLTPDQIRNLYTVVGLSDKTHSNELIGSFGVGSKSPFAYSDQFTVESVVDGTKWLYSAFMNEDGIPEIADLSDGGFDTDENDGLKVSFDIKHEDYSKFYAATSRALYPFVTKPNIIGVLPETVLYQPAYDTEQPTWRQRTATDRFASANYAIMGNVMYSIDLSKLDWQDSECEELFGKDVFVGGNTYNRLKNRDALLRRRASSYRRFDLLFDIGDLTPAASREHLQYDDKTQDAIKSRLSSIMKYYTEQAVKEFKNLDDVTDARERYLQLRENKFYSTFRFLHDLLTDTAKTFELNGKEYDCTKVRVDVRHLDEYIQENQDDAEYELMSFTAGSQTSIVRKTHSRRRGGFDLLVNTAYYGHYNANGTAKKELIRPVYIIEDETYYKIAKMRHYSSENAKLPVYFFSPKSDKEREKIYEYLTVECGISPDRIQYISNLEKPPKKKKKKSTDYGPHKIFKNLKKFSGRTWRGDHIWTNHDAPNVNDVNYYVVRSRKYWNFKSAVDRGEKVKQYGADALGDAVSVINKFPGIDEHINVYSVPPSKVKNVPDNWQPIEKLARDLNKWLLSSLSDDVEMIANLPKIRTKMSGSVMEKLCKWSSKYTAMLEDPELKKWVNKVKSINDTSEQYSALLALNKSFMIMSSESYDQKFVDKFNTFYNQLDAQYELIGKKLINLKGYYQHSFDDKEKEAVINYINMVYNYTKENK